ncbi:MAG: lipid-binding SYLF domain-containing protein [Syntrophobacteraceae bacterium]
MKYFAAPLLVASLLFLGPVSARALPSPSEINRIQNATAIFSQMPATIPAYVLRHAKGIAVIPGVLKAGFIFGGELGKGILSTRLPNGRWSAPSFITLAGASFGFQIGGEVRNIVLIFNTRQAVAAAASGNLKLGVGASVTAGPVGAGIGANTAMPSVYSYVSSMGAFIGATVKGAVLSIDYSANVNTYGRANPLGMSASGAPGAVRNFVCVISRATGTPTRVCG